MLAQFFIIIIIIVIITDNVKLILFTRITWTDMLWQFSLYFNFKVYKENSWNT